MTRFLTNEIVSRYLRVQDAENEEGTAFIEALTDAALNYVSERTGIAFGERVQTDRLDGGGYALWPLWRPVRAISGITDTDTSTAVLTTDYFLDRDRITHELGARWGDGAGRFQTVYHCGYEPMASLASTTGGLTVPSYQAPAGLTFCILHFIRRLYDARGGVTQEQIQGWSVTWDDLGKGEIETLMRPYMRLNL